MLARNIRIEEDLVDQLFNSSEKRLARALLLLARYGKPEQTIAYCRDLSGDAGGNDRHDRSRVNFFMNNFRKLGFIEYNGGLKVNHSADPSIVHRVVFTPAVSEPCHANINAQRIRRGARGGVVPNRALRPTRHSEAARSDFRNSTRSALCCG
jgi:hypothetical protein